MIFTVVGKPGGGKTFYSLRGFADRLVNTDDSIVTIVSVDVPALEAYIAKKHPDRTIEVSRRIRLIDEKQARRFWLYRIDRNGLNVDLKDITRDQEKVGEHVDFSVITDANRAALAVGSPRPYPGILYAIDECHCFFDARAWAESGMGLTFYNSQHRKLDDDVMFITQFLELIDKRVKGFSQEFIYVRNNGAEKLFTLFRGPAYFTAKHYQRPPGLQDYPSEVHRFSLDLDLAKCYDTSAGVGIKGVGKPESKRKKGISIIWIMVPVILIAVIIHQGPNWLLNAYAKSKNKSNESSASAAVPSASQPAVSIFGASASPASVGQSPARSEPSEPIWPTGYAIFGRKINIQMSDGTYRIEGRSDGLVRIERNGVFMNGQKHYFKPSPRPVVSVEKDFSPVYPSSGSSSQDSARTVRPSVQVGRVGEGRDGSSRRIAPSSEQYGAPD